MWKHTEVEAEYRDLGDAQSKNVEDLANKVEVKDVRDLICF